MERKEEESSTHTHRRAHVVLEDAEGGKDMALRTDRHRKMSSYGFDFHGNHRIARSELLEKAKKVSEWIILESPPSGNPTPVHCFSLSVNNVAAVFGISKRRRRTSKGGRAVFLSLRKSRSKDVNLSTSVRWKKRVRLLWMLEEPQGLCTTQGVNKRHRRRQRKAASAM